MKLSYETILLHPHRTFKIATSATNEFPVTFCRIEHDGVVGIGEASPAKRISGEDARTVSAFLDWAAGEVSDLAPDDWKGFLAGMHENICGNPGARNAVDLAIHDLIGKLHEVPARELYGLPRARLETSMTVSLDEPQVMAEEAQGYHAKGFACLKLKLGDAPRDAERVAAVREACPTARLRADANTGWTMQQAREVLPDLADLGVEFLEQPFKAQALVELADLSRWSPIPIYADESVHDALDVERLHKAGFVGGVNVKLVKAGGLMPAVRALASARELGYPTQLGCNVESAVGIAGAVQLLSLLDHADLDGHLLLKDDPFEGPMPKNGEYSTPTEAGLGARLKTTRQVV